MNDRQRLEAIVTVVCKYLPPDGISREQAMTEIISLIDPLPEQEQEPVESLCCPVGKCAYRSVHKEENCPRENVLKESPQRTWVGLDHQDKKKFSSWLDHKTDDEVFTAIDDLLREMNT